MKKMKFLFISLLAAALLASCGTSKTEKDTGDDKEKTETPVAERSSKQKKEEQKTEAVDQTENESGEDAKDEPEKVRLLEKNLTFQVDGSPKIETAFFKKSDNQDYSLYVLADYELTGEEPQKDILYLKEEDTLFMRIELLPANANLNDEIETIKTQLKSVSSDIKEAKPQGHKWLKNATGLTAEDGNERVSTYLIPQKDWLLKLTLFTPANEDAEDPFLKMAETIED
ncbi:hypothetical protein [Bacillus norwichensis]|uniref:Lipoprotein n=1 Tax=Bacillus norwichensis TaxID=2762217 RepID=A0ABR8VLQ2_9BACI|nr:hypothetical protein [Bacillus norwichensis]MBD8005695.1 hypothetical protein [Bacillus norwichensis]